MSGPAVFHAGIHWVHCRDCDRVYPSRRPVDPLTPGRCKDCIHRDAVAATMLSEVFG